MLMMVRVFFSSREHWISGIQLGRQYFIFGMCVCESPMLPHAIYRGRAREWSTGLNYAAADCQGELRTMSCMLKYGSLCVCMRVFVRERKNASTLVYVHV